MGPPETNTRDLLSVTVVLRVISGRLLDTPTELTRTLYDDHRGGRKEVLTAGQGPLIGHPGGTRN